MSDGVKDEQSYVEDIIDILNKRNLVDVTIKINNGKTRVIIEGPSGKIPTPRVDSTIRGNELSTGTSEDK